jgi:DNA repair exonuclease SbcCD nuclease subunit
MKIAIITDTHYCFKKSSKIYHDYFEKFYNNIFFPELKKRKIDTVIHMGDAFDNRRGVDYWGLSWAQNVVYNKFRDLGITLYQIMGNHDAYHKTTNSINSIDTLLHHYENVISITEPHEITISNNTYLMVPWICKDNEKNTFDLIEKTNSKVVFGHFEFKGFTLFPGQTQTHGLSSEKFEKFDRVFSGHYHTKSDNGKIFYLGNPYQMFWSDVDDSRGFSIFDTETYEIEFIENPYTMYEKIYYDNLDPNEFDFSIVENKNIKLIIKNCINRSNYEIFVSEILKRNIVDLKIIESSITNESSLSNVDFECENTLSILDKYIEESDFSLNKEIVKNILHETYKEALEMELI